MLMKKYSLRIIFDMSSSRDTGLNISWAGPGQHQKEIRKMSSETETKEQKKPIIETSTTKPNAATHSENTAESCPRFGSSLLLSFAC